MMEQIEKYNQAYQKKQVTIESNSTESKYDTSSPEGHRVIDDYSNDISGLDNKLMNNDDSHVEESRN